MFFRKSKIIKQQQEEIGYLKRTNHEHNFINRVTLNRERELVKENKKLKSELEMYKSALYRKNE